MDLDLILKLFIKMLEFQGFVSELKMGQKWAKNRPLDGKLVRGCNYIGELSDERL